MRTIYLAAIASLVVLAMSNARAADKGTQALQSTTLLHAGGFRPLPPGDILVGIDAAARDSLLPSPVGDAAFYDDAPGCTLFQGGLPFAHRYARVCRQP